LVAEDLNIRVESVQQGYPDCTGIRCLGKGRWERIRIEFEYRSSSFDHDPTGCDIIVCWEDDLSHNRKKELVSIEIIELKTLINTPEIPNKEPRDPEEAPNKKTDFDLPYHYKRKGVAKEVQKLYEHLHDRISTIDKVWRKFAKTAITYYSPEKNFAYLTFKQSLLSVDIYTNKQEIKGVRNIKYHENWGTLKIKTEKDIPTAVEAIKKSYEIIKQAIKDNINTGWYAATPKEKLTWLVAK
jgi:predicted transport protein